MAFFFSTSESARPPIKHLFHSFSCHSPQSPLTFCEFVSTLTLSTRQDCPVNTQQEPNGACLAHWHSSAPKLPLSSSGGLRPRRGPSWSSGLIPLTAVCAGKPTSTWDTAHTKCWPNQVRTIAEMTPEQTRLPSQSLLAGDRVPIPAESSVSSGLLPLPHSQGLVFSVPFCFSGTEDGSQGLTHGPTAVFYCPKIQTRHPYCMHTLCL